MDERLRRLERLARSGDQDAKRALERARLRAKADVWHQAELTPEQLAEGLGVELKRVKGWLKNDHLTGRKQGRSWVIGRVALLEFVGRAPVVPFYTARSRDRGVGRVGAFNKPSRIAIGPEGTVYVADTGNHRIVAIARTGEASVVAGTGAKGHEDGSALSATFNSPQGVAVDGEGAVYVADTLNHRLAVIEAGAVRTLAGQAKSLGKKDGVGAAARFRRPTGLAWAPGRGLLVADALNGCVRLVTHAGEVSTVISELSSPQGVAVDAAGTIFVADSGTGKPRRRGSIRTVTIDGVQGSIAFEETLWIRGPSDVVVRRDGTLFFTDAAASSYTSNALWQVRPTGEVSFSSPAGGYGEGPLERALFATPLGLAVDADDSVYVVERQGRRVRKVLPPGPPGEGAADMGQVREHAEAPLESESESEPEPEPEPDSESESEPEPEPESVSRSHDAGYSLVMTALQDVDVCALAGASNGELIVRTRDAIVRVGADRRPEHLTEVQRLKAKRRSFDAQGLAVGGDGTIFWVEKGRCLIRLEPGGPPTLFAGSRSRAGCAVGSGEAARFKGARGLAVDANGTLILADAGNHRVCKISADGDVRVFSGGRPGRADGTADRVGFEALEAIALAPDGAVWVVDGNRLRRIDSSGTVTTVAGDGQGYVDGRGPGACFCAPLGLAVDDAGVVFVADTGNHCVRRVTPDGSVTTLAGSRYKGVQDGGIEHSRFNYPHALTITSDRTLWVGDSKNQRLRAVRGRPWAEATLAGTRVVREHDTGWFGEPLPERLRRGVRSPFYVWESAPGLDLELVYVPAGSYQVRGHPPRNGSTPAFWITRRRVTYRELSIFLLATGRDPLADARSPTHHAARRRRRMERHSATRFHGIREDDPDPCTHETLRAFADWAGLPPTPRAFEERGTYDADGRLPDVRNGPAESLFGLIVSRGAMPLFDAAEAHSRQRGAITEFRLGLAAAHE